MKIDAFKMERLQSTWENVVEFNLSESGVHPLSLRELVSAEELEEILRIRLGYSQTNGTPELRDEIRKLYPGAVPEQILVTAGSSEANFLLMWSNIEPGDDVVFQMPNYMQMWGLLRGFGARVKPFFLRESLGWQPDLDELKKVVTGKTKMIIVTNPNNPTGAVLSRKAMDKIVELAATANAWILSDEVYQGAEREGPTSPSFWGKYDKTIVVGGLSKSYGLAGVRVGWILGPEALIRKTWPYHDYTTISPSILSARLAKVALKPPIREKIIKRTRWIIQTNFPVLESWLNRQKGLFKFIPPKVGAICFARYRLNINSTKLVDKLIRDKSVLVIPGDHFRMDHYLRLGFGSEKKYLEKALGRVDETMAEVRREERRLKPAASR